MLGEIAQQRAGVGLAEQRRRLAHRDCAGSEGLDGETKRSKLAGARKQPFDGGFVQFHDFRDQQDLTLHAISCKGRLQPFIDDALVGSVLIHDNEAVAGLRYDVDLVDLRALRTKRATEQVTGRLIPTATAARSKDGSLPAAGREGERRQSQLVGRGANEGRNADIAVPSLLAAVRFPSRDNPSFSACTISARTRPALRKRTSVLAGCTLASTPSGSRVTNSATTGWRSRGR